MTVQVSDSVIYQGRSFSLSACSNGEPFDPAQHGYRPVMASTACWRGYVCEYKIEIGRLLLDTLHMSHDENDLSMPEKKLPPVLNGSVASESSHGLLGKWFFEEINLPLDYTGGLIVAQGSARSSYTHVSHHPAWNSEEVHELIFESGELKAESDLSHRMAEIRKYVEATAASNRDKPSEKDIEAWIKESFQRDYTRRTREKRPRTF